MEFLVCVDGIWNVVSGSISCTGEVQSYTLDQISGAYIPTNLSNDFGFGFGVIMVGWIVGFVVNHIFGVIKSI